MLEKWRNGLKKLLAAGNKETMLILFLSGILIFVILLPAERKESTPRKDTSSANPLAANTKEIENTYRNSTSASSTSSNSYKESLERELEEFLSGVEGVGKVKVLIYMKNSQEYIVEKNKPTTNKEGDGSREATIDEETVYTVDDNGNQVPFISRTVCPSVDGVVIAAQGAREETVRLRLVRLAMSLFGVEANKVEVLVLEEN